jgi:glutathione S-transferase
LDDNGFVVWESRAISQYLAEAKDKQLTLFSNIPKERALIQQRMFFDLGTLMPRISALFVSIVSQCRLVKTEVKLENLQRPVWQGLTTVISAEAKTSLYEAFEWLDTYLEQSEWFVCEYATIADFHILASVSTAVVSIQRKFHHKNYN